MGGAGGSGAGGDDGGGGVTSGGAAGSDASLIDDGDASDAAVSSGGDAESGVSDRAPIDGDASSDRLDATTTDAARSDGDAACVSEGTVAFCNRLGKDCGNIIGIDNCGKTISADCGRCPPLQTCGGDGRLSICGALPNLAQGGTVTSSNPNVAPEDMTKAFDGLYTTKWFAGGVTTAWIAYQFAGTTTHVVTSYAITSANDVPTRDPANWLFQGSMDGTAWTTLDSRVGETFANRFQTNGYAVNNTTAYPRYRLNILANQGATAVQLAELQLFGN
jgi:hypothetical protein